MPAHDPPCSAKRFRAICDEIRALCPTPRGMRVKFRRVSPTKLDLLGNTTQRGRTVSIEISSNLTETETEDTVLHEYAHVLSWRPFHAITSDHDAHWGIAFSDVYRAYHGTR